MDALNRKLIWNSNSGIQECMDIGVGGGCNDKSKEIWNENTDGKLDPDLLKMVGGLVRKGDKIFFDQGTMDAQNEALAEIQSEKDKKAKEKESRIAMLQNVASAKTVEDLQAILSAVCVEMGFEPINFFEVDFHIPFTPPKRVNFFWITLAASLLGSLGVNLIFKFLL